jgi:hypothetical protein
MLSFPRTQLARRVVVRAADNDEGEILRLISTADFDQLASTTAYLSQVVAAARQALALGHVDQALDLLMATCAELPDAPPAVLADGLELSLA